jgi:tetratricopeptide (TPR) repeat protein
LAECFYYRGLAYAAQKKHTAAAKDRQEALNYGLDPAMVHYQFGRVQAEQKDWNAARTSLRQALKHEPNHKEALKLLKEISK